MSRYKVNSSWSIDSVYGADITASGHATLVADALDTKTGDVFRDGAWAVSTVKPGTKGSRGRPFYGETAWSDAERLAMDLAMADRYNR